MVLLTMTPLMAEGLGLLQAGGTGVPMDHGGDQAESAAEDVETVPPSEPAVGRPIAHDKVVELWQALKGRSAATASGRSFSLEALLAGSEVYVPPKPPKPEPSPAYQALMARLRRNEEARAYERMVRAPDAYDASAFAQVHRPRHAADTGDDAVTLRDTNRQAMLVLNFVLTMAGVAYALWVLARWWPTPSRLFLAMGGCVLVGLAEYGLYAGYVWHLLEAAEKDKAVEAREVKEVVQTWVVSGAGDGAGDALGATAPGKKEKAAESKDKSTPKTVLLPERPTRPLDETGSVRRRANRENQEQKAP